ncbi:MAG: hypothetical protein IT562_24600 [Alphaproteobacteria bacterium]|nr:hypothetical protein [Alphaproteobacteria bacterium]
MSRSEPEDPAFLFDDWVVQEFRRDGGFTALIVLVAIAGGAIEPLRSSFAHVIGDELDWAQLSGLLAGAGVQWDGVMIEAVRAEDGGPLDNPSARVALRVLEHRIDEDRLAINDGHFFDQWGRRMKVEQVESR